MSHPNSDKYLACITVNEVNHQRLRKSHQKYDRHLACVDDILFNPFKTNVDHLKLAR
jgi:hypothetical protein